jgi:hypothetical protein
MSTYTPLNLCIYLAACQGSQAGLVASGKYPIDPTEADYADRAIKSDALAQAVDEAWGSGSYTESDTQQIRLASYGIWSFGRSPVRDPEGQSSAAYGDVAAGIVAGTRAGTAQITAEGLNPNGCAGSSPSSSLPYKSDNNHTGSPIAIGAGQTPGTIVVSVTITPTTTGKLRVQGLIVAQSTGEGGDSGNACISHGSSPAVVDFAGAPVTVPGPTGSSSQIAFLVEYGTGFGNSAQPAFAVGTPVQINLAVGSVSGNLEVLDTSCQVFVTEVA